MSGIVGIYRLDDAPIQAVPIHEMIGAVSHLGSDGQHIVKTSPVAFGHLMMWTTPESQHETLPLSDPTAGLLITADARIDNRIDLAMALGIQHSLGDWSDSALILAAYRRWDEACVAHLQGAFAFVIWDARQQVLFCATDHFNLRPFFYYHDRQQFVFASEIKAILAVPEIPRRLDEKKLAFSALNIVDLKEKQRSYWHNISQATAASVIKVTREGITTYRYWQADPDIRLSYKRDSEWLEAFQQEITAAIDACTRSAFPVAIMLSGGLDSSSITSVAARRLAEQGRSLITVSAVNADATTAPYQDEIKYIEQFRSFSNLDLLYVPATGRGPLDKLEEIVKQRLTPFVDSRHFLMSALTEAAVSHGARTLLLGMAGEFGPTALGNEYFAELFVRGAWWTLARECWLYSRNYQQSFASVLKSQVVRPLLPPIVMNRLRPPLNPWPAFQPLRKDFVEGVLGENCWQEEQNLSLLPLRPNHRRVQVDMLEPVEILNYMESYLGYEQVRLNFPFLNKRLLEFCIAAPGRLKVRNGYKRYLARAGLDKILPPAIQWRTTKEPFSPDYPMRYNHQRAQLQEFFAAIPSTDPVREIIDVPRMQSFAELEADANSGFTLGSYVALAVMPRAVALTNFLRLF